MRNGEKKEEKEKDKEKGKEKKGKGEEGRGGGRGEERRRKSEGKCLKKKAILCQITAVACSKQGKGFVCSTF